MDYHEEIVESLAEMFPDVKKSQIRNLVKSGDDINVIITRILDNNIENHTYDLKDLVSCNKTIYTPTKIYNYPEVFEKISGISVLEDVNSIRKKASKLYEESNSLIKNAISHEIKSTRIYYSIEAQNKRDEADSLNRKAAMILMRRAVESNGAIDLHGLCVKEAQMFIDDLYTFRNFKEITVVTGQAYKSKKLRPAMEKWFKDHGFTVVDKGASLYASKKRFF